MNSIRRYMDPTMLTEDRNQLIKFWKTPIECHNRFVDIIDNFGLDEIIANRLSMDKAFNPEKLDAAQMVKLRMPRWREVLKRNDRIAWGSFWEAIEFLYNEMHLIDVVLKHLSKDPWDEQLDETAIDYLSSLVANMEMYYHKTTGIQNIITPATLNNNAERINHFIALADIVPEIKEYIWNPVNPWVRIAVDLRELEGEWRKNLGRNGKVLKKHGDNIFMDFNNGWAWVLLPRGYCDAEAKAMGHCGTGPKGSRILSFRKIESDEVHRPHLTFILEEGNILGEMKGKQNAKPVRKYHQYITALLKDPRIKGIKGGGYLPQNNFHLDDLTLQEQEQIFIVKPDWATPKFLYEKEGWTKEVEDKVLIDLKKAGWLVSDQSLQNRITFSNNKVYFAQYQKMQPPGELDDFIDIQLRDKIPQWEKVRNSLKLDMVYNVDVVFPTWQDFVNEIPDDEKYRLLDKAHMTINNLDEDFINLIEERYLEPDIERAYRIVYKQTVMKRYKKLLNRFMSQLPKFETRKDEIWFYITPEEFFEKLRTGPKQYIDIIDGVVHRDTEMPAIIDDYTKTWEDSYGHPKQALKYYFNLDDVMTNIEINKQAVADKAVERFRREIR